MYGIFTHPMIRVSDITTFNKCPRMCYFINHGHDQIARISPGFLEGLILKELALTYENVFDSDDKQIFLNNELERISKEIRVICRNELSKVDDATLERSITDILPLIEAISSNLSMSPSAVEVIRPTNVSSNIK